jgi:hypothetical protein
MSTEESPRRMPRVFFEAVIALAVLGLGWYGLSQTLQQRPYLGDPLPRGAEALVPYRVLAAPNVPAIALFLLSGFALITGAAWLILRSIHQVFFKPVRAVRVWREAVLIALFVTSLAWLQLNQAFSLVVATAIAVALILLEIFLNIRVRESEA